MAAKSRIPLILGVSAAGGVGYYLYNAGGSPRAAEKRFESKYHTYLPMHILVNHHPIAYTLLGDAHRVSAKLKGELPPQHKTDVQHHAEKAGKEIGGKFDEAVSLRHDILNTSGSES